MSHNRAPHLESGPTRCGWHFGCAADHAIPGWEPLLPRAGFFTVTDVHELKGCAEVSEQVGFGRPQEPYRWPAASRLAEGEHQER